MLVVCFLYRSFNKNRPRRSRDLYDEPGSLQESNSDAETYWIKAAFSASTALAAAFLLRVFAAFLAASALLALDIAMTFFKNYVCYVVKVTQYYACYNKI